MKNETQRGHFSRVTELVRTEWRADPGPVDFKAGTFIFHRRYNFEMNGDLENRSTEWVEEKSPS